MKNLYPGNIYYFLLHSSIPLCTLQIITFICFKVKYQGPLIILVGKFNISSRNKQNFFPRKISF